MIGKLEGEVLEAVLETLPVEFSVVDAADEVTAWNRHDTRIFKRPPGVLRRRVQNCHPAKSIEKVELILAEMKAGTRETARFWIDLPIGEGGAPNKVLIEYFALRAPDGRYLGCLEASRNIEEIRHLEGQNRLL